MNQTELEEFISRRHPEYDNKKSHWDFLESTYEGGRDWFESHIFKYIKEGEKEFEDRLERAYRFNHTREIVDLVNKYIFKGEVTRNHDDASPAVRKFWERATLNNLDINQYMRQVSLKASTLGRVYIVVDNNMAKGKTPLSIADEKDLNAKTYSYIVKPQNVLDMSYDLFGRFNWILIYEVGREDKNPYTSSGKRIDRYRLWTKKKWELYKVTTDTTGKKLIVLEDSGEHSLNEVPVFKCDHIHNHELYHAPALIGDIAYLDRAVANYLSNLDAIVQDQTFSQLAMPAQSLLPGEDAYNKLLEMGTKRIFAYDGEGGAKPMYLSPDVKQAELIVGVVRQIINEIYHSVGMAGERTKQDNSMGIDNSSGVAKAYDFERVNALLTSKADSLDRCEESMIRLVRLWNGQDPDQKELVKYPNDFDIRGLYDELELANRLKMLDAPDILQQEQMKSVIEKLYPRISEDLKQRMIKEIEKWPQPDGDSPDEPNRESVVDRIRVSSEAE